LSHLSCSDVDRGIECLELLSNLGDALAKLALAELLIGGFQSCQPRWERPRPDRARARALFEQVEASGDDASRSAHSTACLMLGRIHKDGLGCARNGALAKRYYRLAIGKSHHGSRPCFAL
jgi:TPR repeat protein